MKRIRLLPIGAPEGSDLPGLAATLAERFAARCEIEPSGLDPEFAFHPERQQYHSTQILRHMAARLPSEAWRFLGITKVDLYIPILTFVFGEAQLGRPCAVVSTYRLRQEYYGLPPDPSLVQARLAKEAIHELGHTLELTHCRDYNCVMAPSHAVEWIDLKGDQFCLSCAGRLHHPYSADLPVQCGRSAPDS